MLPAGEERKGTKLYGSWPLFQSFSSFKFGAINQTGSSPHLALLLRVHEGSLGTVEVPGEGLVVHEGPVDPELHRGVHALRRQATPNGTFSTYERDKFTILKKKRNCRIYVVL